MCSRMSVCVWSQSVRAQDRADGLFISVMNEVSCLFSSAIGQNDFSLSASALPHAGLIDCDEAFISPVIKILILSRC